MRKKLLFLSLSCFPVSMLAADLVAHFPMEADDFGRVTETVSENKFTVYGRHTNENLPGAAGSALRFDGYSTYVTGELASPVTEGPMTFSVWVAPETYPIIKHDEPTQERSGIVGTLDKTGNKGWAFTVGQHGAYSFDCYAGGGWLVELIADDILPCYEWSHLVAVVDTDSKTATLYRNGKKVKEVSNNILSGIENDATTLTIGKNGGSAMTGPYMLDTFNGLIDDVEIYSGILTPEEIAFYSPENYADLTIPESRFAKDLNRPKFHGMPGANWTNETHGMTYSNGRYHVFFQKNANGPYMSRLHWGHISSENLYDWYEEPIAIAPSEEFDIKGCWSGCVFTDDEITGGKPSAIYTGVDYVKAYIVQANPLDEDLIDWEKSAAPIINGRPAGLSDDFRDPYFFRNGNNAYIIVGTSKDNKGAATLHKYNPATKTWSNDGSIFYQAKDVAAEGTFWEMPNVTPMDNGKWLFTVTPQGQADGVHTIYWTGEIAEDGKFIPDSETPKQVELISRQGYGLLSPTIYQHDGKTLSMGIVPDKISTSDNCSHGWAHTYSFPREWSVDNNGNLIQKPFAGLEGLRTDQYFEETNFNLTGNVSMRPVEGRQIEVLAKFEVGTAIFGLEFLKNSKGGAVLTYNPVSNELKVSFQGMDRIVNDNGHFNGLYSCTLPEKPEAGTEMTINLFVDGSILDIFVNNKWATSIRIYANATDANGVEAFAEGGTVKMNRLSAWVLGSEGGNPGGGGAGIDDILGNNPFQPEFVSVYTIGGTLVKRNVSYTTALEGLERGIYIVGDKKVIVR